MINDHFVTVHKLPKDDHDGDNLEYLSNDQWSFYKIPKVSQVFLSFLSFNLFWRFLVTLRSMRCIWTTSPAPTLGRRKQGRCMQSSREDLTRLFQYYQRTVFAVFFWQVEKGIEERNAKLVEEGKIPYTVLLPRKIPTGIAVWLLALHWLVDQPTWSDALSNYQFTNMIRLLPTLHKQMWRDLLPTTIRTNYLFVWSEFSSVGH